MSWEKDKEEGSVRYQGCVLLHRASHGYVCVSSVDAGVPDETCGESQPAKLRSLVTTQH